MRMSSTRLGVRIGMVAPIVVKPTKLEQSKELILDRAGVLLLKAIDATTGARVERVNSWYEAGSQPDKK